MIGIILKGIGGFYYVKTEEGIFECKARGLFRKEKISPFPGDQVEIMLTHEQDREAYIKEILPRKNIFIRPPLANVDKMFVTIASKNPKPQLLLIDKTIALCEKKEIEPVLVINKIDIAQNTEIRDIYRGAGFEVIEVSAVENIGIERIKESISGHICVFAGASGVGKSSIVNRLTESEHMEVGLLSEKNIRGKHTTRHVELLEFAGGYIADTPGYADISTERFELILKDELADCFREFSEYYENCRFATCKHLKEPDCAVKKALSDNLICKSRYDNYVTMYREVENLKEWELK